jgi:hypothetical protein
MKLQQGKSMNLPSGKTKNLFCAGNYKKERICVSSKSNSSAFFRSIDPKQLTERLKAELLLSLNGS